MLDFSMGVGSSRFEAVRLHLSSGGGCWGFNWNSCSSLLSWDILLCFLRQPVQCRWIQHLWSRSRSFLGWAAGAPLTRCPDRLGTLPLPWAGAGLGSAVPVAARRDPAPSFHSTHHGQCPSPRGAAPRPSDIIPRSSVCSEPWGAAREMQPPTR